VRISSDLKSANVSVSVLGDEAGQRTTLRGLEHAQGYIQRRLFKELNLKYVPRVVFHLDQSIERSIKISKILREEGVPETGGFGETEAPDEIPDIPGAQEEPQDSGEPQ
jgi:ribosome-binding factor A